MKKLILVAAVAALSLSFSTSVHAKANWLTPDGHAAQKSTQPRTRADSARCEMYAHTQRQNHLVYAVAATGGAPSDQQLMASWDNAYTLCMTSLGYTFLGVVR